jgi:hypothetical protein
VGELPCLRDASATSGLTERTSAAAASPTHRGHSTALAPRLLTRAERPYALIWGVCLGRLGLGIEPNPRRQFKWPTKSSSFASAPVPRG